MKLDFLKAGWQIVVRTLFKTSLEGWNWIVRVRVPSENLRWRILNIKSNIQKKNW